MDNEYLFTMLDECISHAAKQLTGDEKLSPFAMVLEQNNAIRTLDHHEEEDGLRYELLLEMLRFEAKAEIISAMALVSHVTIPENFSPAVSSGIRIHVEERTFEAKNTLSARLLYVPYQLFKTKDDPTIQIHLHDPIPVGLACEVFV